MKKLTMIIPAMLEQALADCLQEFPEVHGFTFIHVEGRGSYISSEQTMPAQDQVMGYRPQIRVDMLLEDKNVAPLLLALGSTDIGLKDHTFYWITPVEGYGRL